MSTNNTHVANGIIGLAAGTSEPRQSFLSRFFERIAASRTAQARVQVAAYLAKLSDQRLADIGFTPAEIAAIREKGVVPASYWR
jgi:uncharacterized protein YjiS (DUF1127 family)